MCRLPAGRALSQPAVGNRASTPVAQASLESEPSELASEQGEGLTVADVTVANRRLDTAVRHQAHLVKAFPGLLDKFVVTGERDGYVEFEYLAELARRFWQRLPEGPQAESLGLVLREGAVCDDAVLEKLLEQPAELL